MNICVFLIHGKRACNLSALVIKATLITTSISGHITDSHMSVLKVGPYRTLSICCSLWR